MSKNFKCSDPEFVGEFQVKPAVGDLPKKLGWICYEQRGWEVRVPSANFDQEIMKLGTPEEKIELIHSCENMTEFRQGKKVLVMGFMGWIRGVVMERSKYLSSPHVESGGSIFPLEMSDDRKCWVTTSQIRPRRRSTNGASTW